MKRSDVAERLLLENLGKRVTIRMLQEAGLPGYTARNAVAEAKAGLKARGYSLRHEYHKKGEGVFDNGWILEVQAGQMEFGFNQNEERRIA